MANETRSALDRDGKFVQFLQLVEFYCTSLFNHKLDRSDEDCPSRYFELKALN